MTSGRSAQAFSKRTAERVKKLSPGVAIATAVVAAALVGRPPASKAADGFGACLASLQPGAAASGIDAADYDALTRSLTPNDAPRFLSAQPEFTVPIWDYLGGLVDDRRVADGRDRLRAEAGVLAQVEQRFGVDRRIVTAVWGIESDYGRVFGKRPVLDSLASLSCAPSPRRGYFASEFFAALRILQSRLEPPDRFFGSWAGAFGQTQFMPTTYFQSAVNLEGGRGDVIGSAADALASTANYLRQHGWTPGEPWGFEVLAPAGYAGPTGRFHKRPMASWSAAGIRRTDGRPLGHERAGLFEPAGRDGPIFLVTHNFDVLTSYNAAEAYGLAAGLLADRIAGGAASTAAWPGGERGLSRAERREVQQILSRRGYDVGESDGILGEKSRAAMAREETRLGMAPDGWASASLLARLLRSE
jgi:lytic murein transglycosylase